MKRKRWIDILLLATVALLLTICAFLVKPWVTADAIAVIRPGNDAGGVTANRLSLGCSSCSGSIINRLSLRPGIAWVKNDKKSGLLIVAYDSRTVKPDSIAASLTESGYASSLAGTMGIEQYCRRDSSKTGRSILEHTSCGGYCPKAGEKGEGK